MKKLMYKLDDEEMAILTAFDAGELKPVKNQKAALVQMQAMASEALAKTRRVNIRLSAMDLEGMRARAAEEGMPYQTLMASVLHKYASGRLVDGLRTA